MNLVNDVDFVFAARREANVFAQFTNLIYAIVARSVDLKHIQTDPLRNFSAGVADSARMDGRALDAVHGLGQNAGSRSFARAARPNEKIGVSQALLLNRILQRSNYVILAEDVIENLGAIFSRKDLVTHADIVMSRPGSASVIAVARREPQRKPDTRGIAKSATLTDAGTDSDTDLK